ncbi:MAG: cytochrome c biogenesis protein CcsA [Parvularculaceae bacterium]
MLNESVLLWLAAVGYLAAALSGIVGFRRPGFLRIALWILGAALLAHAVAIGLRWSRLGHGPYANLFEILSSNVWSLHAAAFIGGLSSILVRRTLGGVLPVLQVLTVWLVTTPTVDSALPVTYDTHWLPIHIALGKIFLGLTIIAVGLSIAVLLRRYAGMRLAYLPDAVRVEEAAYRLMLVAVVFESLMLIAGAAWAQDAWGRYWAWDPLETWAFATWAAVIAYIHWRAWSRPRPEYAAIAVIAVFALAFLTFFGVPFISTAPHKGAV